MSSEFKLIQTSRRGIESVNSRLLGQCELLRNYLARQLGPDHAFLLAEPVTVQGGNETIWFAASGEKVDRLVDLPPEQGEPVRDLLRKLGRDITQHADELDAARTENRDLPRLLRDMLVIPDESRILVVDGRPVLVDWGYKPSTEGSVPQNILDIIGSNRTFRQAPKVDPGAAPVSSEKPSEAPPPEVKPVDKPTRRGCLAALLWLLFALLLLVLAAMLLRACAIGPEWLPGPIRAFLPDRCPPAAQIAQNPQIGALEADLRQLEREAAAKQAACGVNCGPTQRAEASPAQSQIEGRLGRAEAARSEKLEISLAWNSTADLDLSVTCPDGKVISHLVLQACGGNLVVDRNALESSRTAEPVEHIIWQSAPPRGRYQVHVHYFAAAPGAPASAMPFVVLMKQENSPPREFRGTLERLKDKILVHTFDIP